MAKTTSNEELAQRIEQLVREHVAESRRVAQEALERAFSTACAAPVQAVSAPTSGRRRRAPERRRAPDEVAALAERLYAAVCAHPGEGMRLLATEVGSSVAELNRPMTNLKRDGRVRSVGERHLTRYFPKAT